MSAIAPPITENVEPNKDRIERLTVGLGKVRARLIKDIVTGMMRSNSMRLTHIAESLQEAISLHATHKRLSRNLGDPVLGQHLQERILRLGAAHILEDTRIILDRFDITKQYARKMEFIEEFAAGAEESCAGYHACEVIASDHSGYWPLDIGVWSSNVPNYGGEQAYILNLVKRVRNATGKNGILVVNAGLGDTDELLIPWTNQPSNRFVIRLHLDRELMLDGQRTTAGEIFNKCPRPYGKLLFKYDNLREEQVFIEFGCVPVRLPGAESRNLWLICAKPDVGRPVTGRYWYALLTNAPEVQQRDGIESIARAYLTRVQAASTMSVARKKLDFDDMRVHSFRRLENLLRLYQSAAYSAFSTPSIRMIDAGITYDRQVSAAARGAATA